MISNEDKELLLDHEKLAEEKRKFEDAYADRQKFLQDWRDGVLNTPAGRRIVWDLLGLLGYQKKMFNSDPLVMAGNCAVHDILFALIKDLEEAQAGILLQSEPRQTEPGAQGPGRAHPRDREGHGNQGALPRAA